MTRSDGNGSYRVGDIVRIRETVRPTRFTDRQGVISEVRRVVPKAIADKIHAEGRTTHNGDFEIGLDLSSPDARGGLVTEAWFLPHELESVTARSERPTRRTRRGPQDRSGRIEAPAASQSTRETGEAE